MTPRPSVASTWPRTSSGMADGLCSFVCSRPATTGGKTCDSPLTTKLWNADGASRDRTGDLVLAKHALSQLSYGPVGLRVASRRMAYDEDLANRIRELHPCFTWTAAL